MRERTARSGSEWQPPAARRWSEAEARDVVNAFLSSGETKAAFARRYGFNDERLRRWMRDLAERERIRAAPAFAPVRLVERAPERRGGVEVVVGKCTVRVGVGFCPDVLREVIATLDKDAC